MTNEFKELLFTSIWCVLPKVQGRLPKNMFECHICVMDSNDDEVNENATWRQLSCSLQVIFPSYSITCFDIVCFGALNWMEKSIEVSDKDMTAIDISSVKLREGIQLPCKLNIYYMEMFNCKLLAFNEVLCYATQASRDEFDIWLLKDWINLIWI